MKCTFMNEFSQTRKEQEEKKNINEAYTTANPFIKNIRKANREMTKTKRVARTTHIDKMINKTVCVT